ncbi:DnaJ protein [Hymenopellis radicata]|nr:DnaJ protein [Hymenopellis radicata]
MRLPTRRFSFIAFYSCSRPSAFSPIRSFSVYRSPCPNNILRTPHPWLSSKRPSDRRTLHATAPLGASKDPYKTLGVAKDASQADVKKAYFALARKYHPDTNSDKNARDKFVEIQEAYDTLKDEKKRAAFDQYGSASQQPGFDPNAFSQAFSGGGASFHDFSSAFGAGGQAGGSSFFESLFGALHNDSPFGRPGSMRGEDIEASINISFMESCKGTKRKVKISPVVDCSSCSGSGLKSGAKRSTCTTCGGSGTRTFNIDSGFRMASTCNACGGTGSTVPRSGRCAPCGGVGKVRTSQTIDVDVPPGVEDGMTIQVSGAGDAPVGGRGSPGDLFVRIRVTQSKQFTRQGANLYHQAQIPFHTALLGGKVRVPTIDGEVDVRLPAGTQQGEEMVLKRRGVPQSRGFSGDLYVTFNLTVPRVLSSRQRDFIQAYADEVEGRSSSKDLGTGQHSSAQSQEAREDDHDNGMPSFTHQSPFGGWLSRAWQRIRELTGL